MKLLALGDIVGEETVEYLSRALWPLRRRLGIDCVVANGENASDIHGTVAQRCADATGRRCGFADYRQSCLGEAGSDPAAGGRIAGTASGKLSVAAPGSGYSILDAGGWRMLAINVMGVVFTDTLADPFDTVEKILDREAGNYDFALLDIHAEATAEKLALARVFDGRIAIIFGTHTHVQTADARILPGGSAYITDLGDVRSCQRHSRHRR